MRRPLPGGVEVAVDQFEPGTEGMDAIELRGRSGTGGDDGDVETAPPARPCEGLAEVARARAHDVPGAEAGRDQFGAAALEAAHRVGRLELDAHRATEIGLQRLAAVQRGVEVDRVDDPAGRLDPLCPGLW